MTDPTPTTDERIGRLEARVAELEQRLGPPPAPPPPAVPPTPYKGWDGQGAIPPDLLEAEMATYRKLLDAVGPQAAIEEYYRQQDAAGVVPTDRTWAQGEIERMLEDIERLRKE